MKRSLSNPCNLLSKHHKVSNYESFGEENPSLPMESITDDEMQQTMNSYCQPAQERSFEWTAEASPPPSCALPAATPSSALSAATPKVPEGYIHLGGELMLGVSEFLGHLKVHLRQYVLKNGQYVPTKRGIVMFPYCWEVLVDNLSSVNLQSTDAFLVIERKIFLSVTDSCVVFQHVFDKREAGLQLSNALISISHDQFNKLYTAKEFISRTIREKLLGPLFLKSIRNVFIIVSSDSDLHDQSESDIFSDLHKSVISILKIHIQREFKRLNNPGNANNDQTEHLCIENSQTYMDRCIAGLDIEHVAYDFVSENRELYPYMSEKFIEYLNPTEMFDLCKFHINIGM